MNTTKFKKWLYERAQDVIGWDELAKKIESGQKIKIKIGADPTKPDLHIGHAVALRLMRKFQDEFDAEVQFLIGDFTAKVGDPTGKSKVRPVLTDEEIENNAKTYIEQVFEILDENKTSYWTNGKKLKFIPNCRGGWYENMPLKEFMGLLSMITHSKLIDRDMFQKRIDMCQEIYMHEMMYPILQGYDSVMMESDLTIIGSDQLFNELVGRFYQNKFGQPMQGIITVPILVGTDGRDKMSKSLGNYIALLDSPDNKFGKTMSIPDLAILDWVKFVSDLDYMEVKNRLDRGENPRNIKVELAHDIVRQYHGEKMAQSAQDNFEKVFSKNNIPDDMEEIEVKDAKINLIDWLVENEIISSKSEARRLINQGAVKVDNVKYTVYSSDVTVNDGMIVRVGKLRFVKLRRN